VFAFFSLEIDLASSSDFGASTSFILSTKALSIYEWHGCHLKSGSSWCK